MIGLLFSFFLEKNMKNTFTDYLEKVCTMKANEGRSKDFDGEYNPKELALGIEIELEHTSDREIAERIAKDHLAEFADYYTRLTKMEDEAKNS